MMEVKITADKENKLLSRREVLGEISFTGATPSNAELKKHLASLLKSSEDCVVVKHIYTDFGLSHAKFSAYCYDSKDLLEKIEVRPRVKTDKKGEAPKAEVKA